MASFLLFIFSSMMSGCTDFLRENCHFERMSTMLVGASIGQSDGRPRLYFIIDKSGYRSTNSAIALYGILDFGSAKLFSIEMVFRKTYLQISFRPIWLVF